MNALSNARIGTKMTGGLVIVSIMLADVDFVVGLSSSQEKRT